MSPPKFGRIEDSTPIPGHEMQNNKFVDSFDIATLENGHILYVQSKHTGIEPKSDLFIVSATDGTHRSAEVYLC